MVLQHTATYVWRTLAAHKSSTSQRVEAAVWRIGEVVDYQHISGELSHLDTPNSCLLMYLMYCHTRVYLVLSANISDELSHLDTPSSCLLMSLMYCHNQVYLVLTADISDELSHLGPPRQPIDHTRRNPITWVFSRSVIRQWVRWQSCSLCYLCEYDMI